MGAGSHDTQEVVINDVSSLDEPSVEWGWHQHSRQVGVFVGGFFVLFLLAMTIGNHEGHVETLWLVSIAVITAIWMALSLRKKDPKAEEAKQNRVFEVSEGHYSLS